MKNDFCFILKGLFVLKVLRFLSSFLGHVAKSTWSERYCGIQNL